MLLCLLPASLLLLIASRPLQTLSVDLEWPYNLPPHVKYFPGDSSLNKRNAEVHERIERQAAVGLRKMDQDAGRMFFLDYWQFEPTSPSAPQQVQRLPVDQKGSEVLDPSQAEQKTTFEELYNVSMAKSFQAPVALHHDSTLSPAFVKRHPKLLSSPIFQRAFSCPNGTSSCDSIGMGDTCCPIGDTCQLVENTGQGAVACCAAGQTCSGKVSTCPGGFSGCPGNAGGGCCLPGYACVGTIGCAHSSTVTVIVNPEITASSLPSSLTASPATTTPARPTSSVLAPLPLPPPSSRTMTTTSSTSTSSPTSGTCTPGYRACPSSLGGGCCPSSRACGRDSCPTLPGGAPTTTTSLSNQASDTSSNNDNNNFGAPVRPTSADIVTTRYLTAAPAACPVGFYQCSAYYHGGCCRVGRDCGLTDCPATAAVTVAEGAGITVMAPAGAEASGTGACASGWSTCNTDVGGGCCPSGYECGTASCSATAKVTGAGASVNVQKVAGEASRGRGAMAGDGSTATVGMALCVLGLLLGMY